MKMRFLGVLIATTGMMMAESELMMITKHKNSIENVTIEAKGKIHRFAFPGEEEARQKYTGKRNEYVKFDERGEI